MTAAVAEKSYADVTIADVVRHAHVSKRTFYEHFADKEACFLAAYSAHSERVLASIAEAAQSSQLSEARLEAATRAYVSSLEEQPEVTRTFLRAVQAAGPKALALRRAIHQRFADLLRLLVEAARLEQPEIAPLSPAMANAIVGGINELLLLTIEDGNTSDLHEVGTTALELVRAVLLRSPLRTFSPRT